MNLIKLKQTENGHYIVKEEFNCHHIKELDKAMERLSPFETMTISNRCIVFKGKIYSFVSGSNFDALSELDSENWDVIQSEPIDYCDKVVFVLRSNDMLRYIFKQDPARRDLSLVGHRTLSYVLSAHMICNDTALFQIMDSISTTDGEVNSYWTMITIEEKIKEIPDDLAHALLKDHSSQDGSKTGAFK